MGLPGGSDNKGYAFNVGDLGLIPGSGRSLEKGMATHSSILAWEILWTEDPGRLQSTGGLKESEMTKRLTQVSSHIHTHSTHIYLHTNTQISDFLHF